MDILKIAYPNFYKSQSEHERLNSAKLWAAMFADDPADVVAAAVKAFIVTDTKGFPPVIGIIKNKIAGIIRRGQMTEYEAWHEVKKALSNGLYGASEEFEKLPPILQRLVGSPNQLRQWAAMDSGDLESIVGSNFMRSYKARAEYERDDLLLPADVKNFIAELSKRVAIPEPARQPAGMTDDEINERRNEIQRLLANS